MKKQAAMLMLLIFGDFAALFFKDLPNMSAIKEILWPLVFAALLRECLRTRWSGFIIPDSKSSGFAISSVRKI
jgi:hypothetical protein